MVLSPRSVDKSQHRVEGLSPEISRMDVWTQRIRRLDVNWFPHMDPWKTYVLTIPALLASEVFRLRSGRWEDHHLVCHFFLTISAIAGTDDDLVLQSYRSLSDCAGPGRPP